MREAFDHYRWRQAGRPDRFHDVKVFNVDPDTADHVDVRSAQFTNHTDAELWLIAHLTPGRPFGQGFTYRVLEIDDVELENGLRGTGIAVEEPDGWCYLDNAATEFEREGSWLPRQQQLDLDID